MADFIVEYCPYTLNFRFEARTSRAAMRTKDTYFIRMLTADGGERIAEVPLFKGLSAEDNSDFENQLAFCCRNPRCAADSHISSIAFGFQSLMAADIPTDWSQGKTGIPINGLIWMGDKQTMAHRIAEKLDEGFRVLKLKIGGIDFDDELDLIADIRRRFSSEDLELRLDANGSFSTANALARLERLSRFGIHSLEQPLPAGLIEQTAELCRTSPVAIALDEELIGRRSKAEMQELLETVRPHYIILKPALCGGFAAADTYIDLAERLGIGWWATSALESNVGLYAIASWLSTKNISLPQGLGTGMLYSNNISSPLSMHHAALHCMPDVGWGDMSGLPWRR